VGATLARAVTDLPPVKGDIAPAEPTRPQQVVARRVAEAKATVPEFMLSTDVDMEACVEALDRLRAGGADPAPTTTDMVVKACGVALRDVPQANAAYRDGRFERYSRVNVGLVVTAQDALVTPTILDADRRSLADIARDARELTDKARAGRITPPEVGGATFTVTDLGAHGATAAMAIIAGAHAGALAVGAVAPRAVARDGAVVVRQTLTATLTADHRILYGEDAMRFLARVREVLEQPDVLLG
jgi:pyruvate dehydrogenase E2 component (dihydrolipoamide acetyltransferase)